MKVDVVMPKMGESIQEGKILRWLKKPGDNVERDEIILEISTDKVDTEVPSPTAGILTALLAQENDTVEVGKVIAQLETESSAAIVHSTPAPVIEKPIVTEPSKVDEKPIIEISVPSPSMIPLNNSANITEVVMPKMGESIQEGKVLRWLKKPGDTIERDEILLEISTDKVDTEVPSPVAGTVSELKAQEGDTVEVGTVIALISSGTVTVSNQSNPIVAPAPAAASVQAPSIVPQSIVHTEEVATPIIDIPRQSGSRFYSPLVRSIAEVEKVSLQELELIKGSGLEGRVTKADILLHIANRSSGTTVIQSTVVVPPAPMPIAASIQQSASVPSVAPVQVSGKNWGNDVEIIPMDRVRQIIADHMIKSKQTSPHVTSVGEADVTQLVHFREINKSAFEKKEGFKLTLTPFFVKAIVDAVKKYPLINVSVDGTNVIRHKKVNLSFATILPDGNLIVPVIKGSDTMNLSGISRSINDLAQRARTKKLSPDEITGGTISMTNMGAWGSLFGTPVINQPQTAIIGIYAVQKRPVVVEVNGEDMIAIRHMLYISITYDHRVIDGVLASSCLKEICQGLSKMNASTIDL
ncbi:dihydrolipoamide acetyltransferase component of pyruvate dehydrogenase complex [Chlorobiota bacterium]|nr:dihydrolipoamide acetyltransferase component of pyruvate dehydrogenase complex [Chlorobiota bacterium]